MDSLRASWVCLTLVLLNKASATDLQTTPKPQEPFHGTTQLPESALDVLLKQEVYYNGVFLDQFKPECETYASLVQNSTDFVQAIMKLNDRLSSQEACYRTLACEFFTRKENSCLPMVDALGTCFPETPGGALANVSCPESLNNIKYHATDHVNRRCHHNGSWNSKSNYSFCRPVTDKSMLCTGLDSSLGSPTTSKQQHIVMEPTCERNLYRLAVVSYVGRGISLASLVFTFIIFWVLKNIRCWRIIIHWNLTASLILCNLSWILLHLLVSYDSMVNNAIFCRFLITMFNYTQMTNYFWCFVEGLYLHMMVVFAYTHDRFNLTTYMLVGWVLPIPFIGVWMAVKFAYQDSHCWIAQQEADTLKADYFIRVPTLVVLLVNAVILSNIVRILITKLRSSGSSDDRGTNYWKAVKAALFLLPMLGFTYIIFLVNPAAGTSGELVFYFVNTFLQSFQGLFVCVIFCFANSEVQTAVRKALRSWRHHHTVPCFKGTSHKRRFSSMSLSRSLNNTQTFRLSHRSQNGNGFLNFPNNNKLCHTEVSFDESTVTQCHLVSDADVAFDTLDGGSKCVGNSAVKCSRDPSVDEAASLGETNV